MNVGGVFASIENEFCKYNRGQLLERMEQIRETRNLYVAHQEKGLMDDAEKAGTELRNWVNILATLHRHCLAIND